MVADTAVAVASTPEVLVAVAVAVAVAGKFGQHVAAGWGDVDVDVDVETDACIGCGTPATCLDCSWPWTHSPWDIRRARHYLYRSLDLCVGKMDAAGIGASLAAPGQAN